jgi:muconolactone delta-isomerase
MEYLVTMTTHVPEGTSEQAVDDVRTREAAHSRELAARGHLVRLWRPPLQPGEWRSLGLFAAADAGQLEEVVPEGTPGQTVDHAKAREAERTQELAGQGHLLRLWTLPGDGRSLGLWRAEGPAEVQAILGSLPLDAWLTVETTPLTPHPSDPAIL